MLAFANAAHAEDGGSGAASRVSPYVAVGWNPIGAIVGRYSFDRKAHVRKAFAAILRGKAFVAAGMIRPKI